MRTILNKELRLPNGAHGAPCITFSTPSTGEGKYACIKRCNVINHQRDAEDAEKFFIKINNITLRSLRLCGE
jgi:hypothetical protein